MFRKKTLLALIITAVLLIAALAGCTTTARYTVSFESNGGSYERPIRVYETATEMELPTPTREGYNFDGWFYDSSLSQPVNVKTIPTEDVTFYARWSKRRVSVTFYTDNFSQVVFVDYGSTVSAESMPDVPVKNGYVGRWDTSYLNPDGQKENVRVPAIYTLNEFFVKYFVDDEIYFEKTATANTAISVPSDPQKDDAVFLGWYSDDRFTTPAAPPKTITAENVSLYARFMSTDGMEDFLTFSIDGDEITVTGLKPSALDQSIILIPAEIDGKAVTAVGSDSEANSFLSEKLDYLYVPSSVKTINARAFLNCTFKEIKLNDGLETIGAEAFANCASLTTITLPATVKTVGEYAFMLDTEEETDGLSQIIFSNGSQLQTMDYGVFYGLTLDEFTLSSSDDYLFDVLSFTGCTIKNISTESEKYAVYNGAVYSADFAELLYLPAAYEGATGINPSTQKIGAHAFEKCDFLTEITVPASVKFIGDYAFAYCSNLTSVGFEQNSLLIEIGNYAFAYGGLTAVSLPESLFGIGEYAFGFSTALTTVELAGDGLAEIPQGAFENCVSLLSFGIPTEDGSEKTYTLPSTVQFIRERAFFGCENLAAFGFSYSAVLKNIENYAFTDCFSLGTVSLPSTTEEIGDYAFSTSDKTRQTSAAPAIPSAVKSIGYRAFANSQVTLFNPSRNLNYLGEEAFMDCTALRSLNLSSISLTEVPAYCFYGCTKISDVSTSSTVEVIADFAFYNCTSLQNVKFGDNTNGSKVRHVGESAFENCKRLNSASSPAVPASLTSVGKRAYFGCSALTSFVVPSNLEVVAEEAFASCTALETVSFAVDSITTTLQERCFADCTNLRSVALPSTLGTRENGGAVKNPFIGCTSLTELSINHPVLVSENGVIYRREGNDNAVYLYPSGGVKNENSTETEFAVAPDVTAIDDYAFYGTAVTALTFAVNHAVGNVETVTLTKIGAYAFAYSSLNKVDLGKRVYEIDDHAFFGCNLNNLTISAEIITSNAAGYSVTNSDVTSNTLVIGDYAFGNTDIQTLSFPSRTRAIGDYSFADCFKLKSITFPSGDGNLTIGASAFRNDSSLTILAFTSGVRHIGDYAFADCYNVEIIEFGHVSDAVSLGAYAFASNHYLRSVSLPYALESLGEGVFSDCTQLNCVTFTNGGECLFEIPDYAFVGSKNLRDVSIPENVTKIGAHAFESGALRQITFIESDSSQPLTIGDYAFFGVKDLTSVELPNRLAEIGDHAFANSGLTEFIYADDPNANGIKIGDYAFFGSALENARLTARISEVGIFAFADTAALNEVVVTSDRPVTISESAFENSSIARLEIPVDTDTLGTIGKRAFANTANLSLTAVFDATAVIDDYAFFRSNIDSVNFPENVNLTLRKGAFAETGSLSACEINASSLTLGDFVFENSNVSKLSLSGNINYIGVGVAANAQKLAEIEINDETGNYISTNGILYRVDGDKTTLLQYPAAKEGAVLDVSSDVTDVADYAFYGNPNLTTLVIRGENEVECGEHSFGATNPALTLYTAEARTDDFADWSIPVSILQEQLNELVVKLKIGNSYSVIGYTGTSSNLTINGIINDYKINSVDKNAFANNARLKSITIGKGITEIGEYAFYNCVALENFTFGENVLTVKAHAFENCRNLTSVQFANGLATVGNYAFANTGLRVAKLPASLTTLGAYSFAYNDDLTEIFFPQNSALSEISNNAFANDIKLTSISFPYSLNTLGNYAFRNCDSLAYLYFNSPSAPTLQSVNALGGTPDGLKIFVDAALLTTYRADPYWRTYATQMLAQDEISEEAGFEDYVLSLLEDGNYRLVCYMGIESNVFINTDVNGNGKITEIGEQAFNQFAEYITLDEGIATIGAYAFTTAKSLKVVSLPLSLTTVGAHAFENLASLNTVNINPYSNLNSIGDYAFYNCTGLENITLTRKLANIGSYAFGGKSSMNLTSVNSEIAADVSLSIGEYAFAYNDKLSTLKFDCAIANLGNGAFIGCAELGSLYLNATGDIVPEIDVTATEVFLGCDRLSVFVPDSTSDAILTRYRDKWKNSFDRALLCASKRIATGLIGEDDNLINQDGFVISPINDSGSIAAIVNYIGSETEVVFPSSIEIDSTTYRITRLGRESNQSNDRTNGRIIGNSVTQITVPESITEISGDAFRGAANLQKVEFEALSRLTLIGQYAFADCTALREITLPKSLVTLSRYAFYNCASLTDLNFETPEDSSLKTNLTIGEHAFENCNNLTEVSLPAYLAHVSEYAFYNANSLASVNIPSDAMLTEIERYAFGKTALRGLSVPASVASLGDSVFFDCNDLQYVRLTRVTGSGYTSLTAANANVFNGVSNPFVKVYVPEVAYSSYTGARGWSEKTIVPDLAFETADGTFTYRVNSTGGTTVTLTGYVGSAKEMTVPASFHVADKTYYVTTVGPYFGNAEIKSVTFAPTYITVVDSYAFAECTALETIVVADSVQIIERYAFANCSALRDVTLPSSLGTVSPFTFANCSSLAEIRIPAGVAKIDDSAFINCASLSRLEINFTLAASIGRNVFTNTSSNLVIVVPETRKEAFQNEWRDYSSLIYDKSDRYGDFILSENETGFTLVQYSGHADSLDLNELTFRGKKITAVNDNAVIDKNTQIIFGETDSEETNE